jgi:hypothetical protein
LRSRRVEWSRGFLQKGGDAVRWDYLSEAEERRDREWHDAEWAREKKWQTGIILAAFAWLVFSASCLW